MKVTIKDLNANIIINKIIKTNHNGFFDLWLTRNMEFNIFIEYMDKRVNGKISTFDNSKTCITDLKLK